MTDTDIEPPELPRGIALAWGVAADPQRGPKREMSVEKIVDAAVELADADGIGAVSMAAVAAKLGFTPMSLYRYVSAKDDLLLLMQEYATGLPPESHRAVEGWRERLIALYQEQVLLFLRHPWMLSLPITGSPITPNSSAWLDALLASLEGTPLTAEERVAVGLAVTGQARWCGIVQAGYTEQSRGTGLTPEEVSIREASLYERVITADEFPALRRAIEEDVFLSPADPFRFGVERLLDGVESYMASLGRDESHESATEWIDLDPAELAGDRRLKEAQKAVREAEKALRMAHKIERQALREARVRLAKVKKSG
ncbi:MULTISPECIES: TetR/AcrR family transcriptional regulator [unclassified Microbacterium]|uniref:TetR/AcrR family transcriptional regulator n=1 Tax=unclassified Microbacterium TaxID=2609290 RepID=UPI000EA9B2BF|nr:MULTISPECIES: TetR/AcrR family transcriptional regulator [unclassified Microbacterium]MBT2484891.1 TetR family transcriptional regulator [Microbacterium sp. ISL-108]RKN67757.1 TetR family transcriptional regulator [Microbacterium sp. CGR2]